jgi:hypothetical protein
MKIDQIIGPDKFEKPVSALAMVPKTGAITRIGRQAYTVMMLMAREQGKEHADSGMFSAPLNTIIRGFDGTTGSSGELKRHLRSMITHVVEWQSPSPAESVEWGACALLSEVRLFKHKGESWLSWAYPPSLRMEMLNPQRYAQIRRSTIAQFRTHAGLALYEICARYKDNPSHVTSKQHWHWWLPVLTGKPTPEQIKTEFRFFNRDTVKPAVDEVNEVSELIVEVREIKVGRSVEFLQFEVRKKPETPTTEKGPINLLGVARACQLGIDPDIAEDLYLRHGEEVFLKAIERLEARLAMKGPTILSRHAYLKSLLLSRVPDESPQVQAALSAEELKIGIQVNEVQQRHERLQKSESERVALIRAEIEALNESSLTALLSGLKMHMESTGASQAVMQRLKDGKWQSALIMGALIRFYWRQSRGTEWSAPENNLPNAQRVEQGGLF